MWDVVVLGALARPPRLVLALDKAGIVVAQAYCLPGQAQDGMDTMKLWLMIAAGFAAGISLVMLGVGLLFQHQHHDGGQMMTKLSRWVLGSIFVSAASGIASVFVGHISGSCTPIPT
jgi:hypothetical protein